MRCKEITKEIVADFLTIDYQSSGDNESCMAVTNKIFEEKFEMQTIQSHNSAKLPSDLNSTFEVL